VVLLKSIESLSWPQYRISLYDNVRVCATCYPLAKPDDYDDDNDDDVIVTVITNL
jgi:hypothetical protein